MHQYLIYLPAHIPANTKDILGNGSMISIMIRNYNYYAFLTDRDCKKLVLLEEKSISLAKINWVLVSL